MKDALASIHERLEGLNKRRDYLDAELAVVEAMPRNTVNGFKCQTRILRKRRVDKDLKDNQELIRVNLELLKGMQ